MERPIDPAIHFQNEATATAGRSNGAESREFEFIKIKASLAGVGLGAALMRPMMFPMEPGWNGCARSLIKNNDTRAVRRAAALTMRPQDARHAVSCAKILFRARRKRSREPRGYLTTRRVIP